jgi:hypothetical protein
MDIATFIPSLEMLASICHAPGISLMRQSDKAAMHYLLLPFGSIFFHSFFTVSRNARRSKIAVDQ